jgi:signal transduction histidine kinase
MRRSLYVLLPDRISAQIALLIVISLAIIHLFITAALFWGRSEIERRPPPGPAGEIAGIVRLIASAPRSERSQMLQHVRLAFPQIDIAADGEAASESNFGDPRIAFLRTALGPQFRVAALAPLSSESRNERIIVTLPDESLLTVNLPLDRPPLFIGGPFFMTLLVILVSVTLLAAWSGRALITPLRDFANAAESFSPDGSEVSLPERGPFEIRAAAGALNRMTRRIKGLIEDRTQMLAAVGHDLRTPITRMRLRSEFIPDHEIRSHMLRDLDQMRAMIDAVLCHLRAGHSSAKKTHLDLAVLLQTVCEEFSDLGGDVRYEGPAHFAISGRPDDLQRAFDNLVDNALRYAGHAIVRLTHLPPLVRIDIEDAGPGIAQADKASMLEPFVRGDKARAMNDASGFGLGLSIANGIVLAHGGRLTLLDREPRGLTVRTEIGAA